MKRRIVGFCGWGSLFFCGSLVSSSMGSQIITLNKLEMVKPYTFVKWVHLLRKE